MRYLSISTFRRLFLLLLLFYSIFHFFQTGMGGIIFLKEPISRYVMEFTSIGITGHYDYWVYGPICSLINLPLIFLPDTITLCNFLRAINFLFILTTAYLLFRIVFNPHKITFGLIVIYCTLWGNFYPLLDAIGVPAPEIFEFLLVVIVYSCLLNRNSVGANRDSMAGIFVGIAMMTKFLPGIFLPYFFIKKRWKALFFGILTVAVIAILAEFLLGWSRNITLQLSGTGGYRLQYHSQSLSGLVGRFFVTFPHGLSGSWEPIMPPSLQGVADITVLFFEIFAMILFSIIFFLRRNSPTNSLMTHIEVSLLVAFMIFIPQWNETYYLIFLLLPLTVMLKFIWEGNKNNIFLWSLFGVLYLSTGSIIVPASIVDEYLKLGHYGIFHALGNLSTPAFSNLGIIIFFAILYLKPAIISTNVPNLDEKAG